MFIVRFFSASADPRLSISTVLTVGLERHSFRLERLKRVSMGRCNARLCLIDAFSLLILLTPIHTQPLPYSCHGAQRQQQRKTGKGRKVSRHPPPSRALAMDLSLRWLRSVCFPWILNNTLAEG